MINWEIIEELFSIYKEKYGESECDPTSVFEGQRDLLEFVMGLGHRLEQKFFDGLGTGYEGSTLERDGVRYEFKEHRRRTVQGLFGKVVLKRAYYVGGRGLTYYPLDARLGIEEGHTPGLQCFVAQFTGQNVYDEALEQFHRIFRPDGKDKISMRKALDMDYELGEGLQNIRQQEIQRVEEQDQPIEKQAPIEGLMAISIDATKVREKLGESVNEDGRKSYQIGFKDAKVASVSAVVWDAKRGEASCVQNSYVCAVEEADQFFKRIWVEMQRRGVDPENQRLLFLGDGAPWIWNRVKDLSNEQSIEVLDFYHACEYISGTCKELYGEQTKEYWRHFKGWTKMFYRGLAAAVIEQLKEIQKQVKEQKKLKAVLGAIKYFQDHLPRMNYRHYRELQLPIGSGTVESACKNVVGGRMKGGGMTWSDRGANGMLQIRSSQESNRFDSDFRLFLKAA